MCLSGCVRCETFLLSAVEKQERKNLFVIDLIQSFPLSASSLGFGGAQPLDAEFTRAKLFI